jgi:ArsR family transcriptional regulator, arsenate/arsenite/antimonite-responsive transcriptional repressor
VQVGPDGMPAGNIASALKLAPNTLTFHLDRLRHARLVTVRREGRMMIYAACYDAMNELVAYLTENCCGCGTAQIACKPARAKRAKTST